MGTGEMKSQTLVIDLVRNWLPTRNTEDYLHHYMDAFDVVVVNTTPEYPGMERIQGKVIWPHVYELNDERQTERDLQVHELFRKFAVATGAVITSIRHDGKMTFVDFKNKELKNVEDMEWISVPLIKEIQV